MKDKFWLALLVALPLTSVAEPQRVEKFINNNLSDVSISGKRVVITSESGVNWCEDIVNDSKKWVGITGVSSASFQSPYYRDGIIQTEKEMIVQLVPEKHEYRWLHYNFHSDNFSVETFSQDGIDSSSLYGLRGDTHGDTFYSAIHDAGILKIENGSATGLLIPGIDQVAPIDTSFDEVLDPALASISIAIKDSLLYSLSESAIYSYNLNTGKWTDTLALAVTDTNVSYRTMEATSNGMLIYLDIANKNTSRSVVEVHRFDMDSLSKTSLVSGNVLAIRENKNGSFYVLDSISSITPISQTGAVEGAIDNFSNRITDAPGFGGTNTMYDIAYGSYGTESIFAIATSIGLVYSTDEHGDETDETPFKFIRQEIDIPLGLDEVYAVPFIMNYQAGNESSYFKYALEESAQVSIDIFDYNMDFVCRIIDNEARSKAGASGQSGERATDYWDGTFSNDGGRSVAPGVYFFRITTDRGEQGFGKIIVAKN